MNKRLIKFLILVILGVLTTPFLSYGFLDDDLGTNLYKNIDEGYNEIKLKQFEFEIKGGESEDLAKNINRILDSELGIGRNCINSDINIKAIEAISYGDIEKLNQYLSQECSSEENPKSITEINNIVNKIKEIRDTYKEKADNKSEEIYEISRINLYSDGTTDNSPFDLIKDLQDIDDLIFIEEVEYDGEDLGFLSSFKKDPNIRSLKEDSSSGSLNNGNNINTSPNNTNNGGNYLSDVLPEVYNNINSNDGNNLVCSVHNSIGESGLLPSEILKLGDNTNSFDQIGPGHKKLNDTNKIGIPAFQFNNFIDHISSTGSIYTGVNDNSQWPCEGFFCIKINFSTYDHKLLGYGESKSLENILSKSNSHLKKAANVSLQQGKMSTNNFEIGLRDLDLPGQFHLGFVIQKKSPPLYDLEDLDNAAGTKKETKITTPKGETTTKSLDDKLTEYYKNMGLDYSRENDLNILTGKDKDQKNTINGGNLNVAYVVTKWEQQGEIAKKVEEKNDFINDQLDKKVNTEILGEFYNELLEVERFIAGMESYSFALSGLIRKMREIPIFTE